MTIKNILFYMPNLTQESGGIRQYSAGLLSLISTFPDRYKIYVLHDNNDPLILDIIKSNPSLTIISTSSFQQSFINKLTYTLHNFTVAIFNKLLFKRIPIIFYDPIQEMVKKLGIDIIHCPYQFIPSVKNVKLICTMHDVQELYFPEFFSPEQRAYRAVYYNNYIQQSDLVIVSYDHVKKDIVNFFQKNEKHVQVLLLRMNNLWFNRYNKNSITSIIQVPFSKFLLYPANFWKHKNHKNLLEAIKILGERGIYINLVLSGDSDSKNGKEIKNLIKEYKLESQIVLVGIVDEIELFSLYKKSLGVVIPTLYEAGSFPLVESILMEIPVICSDVTSLPETLGDRRFIFDPKNVYSIADKMQEIWENEIFRLHSISNSKIQKKRLIETNADSILISVYDSL